MLLTNFKKRKKEEEKNKKGDGHKHRVNKFIWRMVVVVMGDGKRMEMIAASKQTKRKS